MCKVIFEAPSSMIPYSFPPLDLPTVNLQNLVTISEPQPSHRQKQVTNTYGELYEDLYYIIRNSIELPPNVRRSYDLPSSCRRWDDLWALESQLPQIQEQADFLERLHEWHFKKVLRRQYGRISEGKLVPTMFGATDREIKLARKMIYEEEDSDETIAEDIARVIYVAWKEMQESEKRAAKSGGSNAEEDEGTFWLGAGI